VLFSLTGMSSLTSGSGVHVKTFQAADAAHGWLNDILAIGEGSIDPDRGLLAMRYYACSADYYGSIHSGSDLWRNGNPGSIGVAGGSAVYGIAVRLSRSRRSRPGPGRPVACRPGRIQWLELPGDLSRVVDEGALQNGGLAGG